MPKITAPLELSDFRPISVTGTSVLCRTMERIVVRRFLYPAIHTPPAALHFDDQYAFRPTGSTTAAIIALLQSTTCPPTTCWPTIRMLALDFSKAFDTVRHAP